MTRELCECCAIALARQHGLCDDCFAAEQDGVVEHTMSAGYVEGAQTAREDEDQR